MDQPRLRDEILHTGCEVPEIERTLAPMLQPEIGGSRCRECELVDT